MTDLLLPFLCQSAGEAIDILAMARSLCLKASYHPSGGMACTHYVPITHTAWIMGSPAQVERFMTEFVAKGMTHEPSHH